MHDKQKKTPDLAIRGLLPQGEMVNQVTALYAASNILGGVENLIFESLFPAALGGSF